MEVVDEEEVVVEEEGRERGRERGRKEGTKVGEVEDVAVDIVVVPKLRVDRRCLTPWLPCREAYLYSFSYKCPREMTVCFGDRK